MTLCSLILVGDAWADEQQRLDTRGLCLQHARGGGAHRSRHKSTTRPTRHIGDIQGDASDASKAIEVLEIASKLLPTFTAFAFAFAFELSDEEQA